MKRTLTSLAAMLVAGAGAGTPAIFGRYEHQTHRDPKPLRIGPMLSDPDPGALDEIRRAVESQYASARLAEAQRAWTESQPVPAIGLRGTIDLGPFWNFPWQPVL